MKKKKKDYNTSIFLFALAIVCIIFIAIFLKVFITGNVVKDNPKSGYCFFNLTGNTLSMYPCNAMEDCQKKILELKNDEQVREHFDVSRIEVLECFKP
ncbi:MAG: hypothetical protein Q8N99_00370 [Nanoarchaeota archaeon]|nr:hypothetical protein [Nanoarchaeota archaeon]